MRIKNIKLSFLILGGLMILSFAFFSAAQESSTSDNNVFLDSDQDGLADTEEKTYGTDPLKADTDGDSYSDGAEVAAGYDPTKPAPGDRVVPEETAAKPESVPAEGEANLTEEITDKISNMVDEESSSENGEITLDAVQSVIDESLQAKIAEENIPEVKIEEIKIKEQNYEKLSEEKRELKKKEDFLSYLVGVSYVVSSNSPTPLTSESELNSAVSSYGQKISSAIVTQNPAALDGLAVSGEKIMEQMKDIEVPEELVDLHLQGLQFSKYAVQLKDDLSPNPEDPMGDVVKFSKMQGLLESVFGFSLEIQNKISHYDITTVKNTVKELKEAGADIDVK